MNRDPTCETRRPISARRAVAGLRPSHELGPQVSWQQTWQSDPYARPGIDRLPGITCRILGDRPCINTGAITRRKFPPTRIQLLEWFSLEPAGTMRRVAVQNWPENRSICP
jgi:hypothetical protein